ncbi:MAG: hypothetical protein GY755_12025 [Chloroflexi bacterium]|nr:hypothetical protein [Chloroflexota bacterium]
MQKKTLFLLGAVLFISLACTLGGTPPAETPNTNNSIATSVALTLAANGQSAPGAELPTPLPTMTESLPPTATLIPTIALTATPSVPMISVSVNTNCRTGPGKNYDYLGALVVGEKAEIVGKNTSNDYWVIKNPDASGNCWLWGYYATVSGNTANLTEYIVPPTPTPSIPLAPSNFTAAKTCTAGVLPAYDLEVKLSWVDNATNENGFYIYEAGVLDADIKQADVTQHTMNAAVSDGVPITFAISAYNGTGESAQATVQVVCP